MIWIKCFLVCKKNRVAGRNKGSTKLRMLSPQSSLALSFSNVNYLEKFNLLGLLC